MKKIFILKSEYIFLWKNKIILISYGYHLNKTKAQRLQAETTICNTAKRQRQECQKRKIHISDRFAEYLLNCGH